jgi:protein-tyrosine phosphatase
MSGTDLRISHRLPHAASALLLATFLHGAKSKNKARKITGILGFVFLTLSQPFPKVKPKIVSWFSRWLLFCCTYVYIGRYGGAILPLPDNGLLKKGSNGRFSLLSKLLYFPYNQIEASLMRKVQKSLHKKNIQNRWDEVAGILGGSSNRRREIYLGEWLNDASELPPGVRMVVDFTNEVEEHSSITDKCKYLHIPVWDQTLPRDLKAYRAGIEEAAAFDGPIYVHCIMGRERSSVGVALMMLKRGLASTVEEAYTALREKRPAVEWREEQMAFAKSEEKIFRCQVLEA